MTNILKNVFNWSEVHPSEMTCYKIHTLRSPMAEPTVKIQTNISEENQNPSSFVIESPDDVFSTTPMTTNFKLSTDKIDTSETNTRNYSKQSLLDRRDSFRLSFHRQGSISSALGTVVIT